MIGSIFTWICIPLAAYGHGYMAKPAAVYVDPPTSTSYIYRVDGNTIFPGLKWNDSPQRNSDQLTQKIDQGLFPDLKSFTNRYVSGCPINDLSKAVDTNRMTTFQWQNDEERKGFVESHEGPCELWIDSQRIFNHSNCARAYTDYPAVLPVDYSVCQGRCQFEFYWMAMQEPLWQIYKACSIITHDVSTAPKPSPATPVTPSARTIRLSCTESMQSTQTRMSLICTED